MRGPRANSPAGATMTDTRRKHRILILGGGFAGVHAAKDLESLMTRAERDEIEVTLVTNENYMVFQPLLPEVISGTIETLHCITPIRRLARRTQIYTRPIEAIDLVNKTVQLGGEFQPKLLTLHYDQLVIGLGTRLNYKLVPGMREHATPFKYLGDALRLRNETVGMLEEADIETDPVEKKKLLTFVVAGGGFSGVECLAELNDFLQTAVKAYQHINYSEIRCILLQSADRILPELDPRLASYAHKILEQRGIEIRLNTRLKAVSADSVLVQAKGSKEQEQIATRTVVTTVPAAPSPLIETLPCPCDAGRIKVNEFLEVPEYPGVWALGDCAAVPQKDGIISPPTAQHAIRQARTCATNILATIRSTKKKPFLFTGLGKLASLGRGSAVAEVFGIRMWGIPAWMFWRAVYLSKIPGFDRKVRIALDWLLDFILPRDITQVRIFRPDNVVSQHFHAGETVFDAGDFGDKLYAIADGEVEVVKNDKVVATLSAGDVFGEVALVSDQPRNARIRAKTDVNVITVSRQAFKRLVAHLPGVRPAIHEIMQAHGFTLPLNDSAEMPTAGGGAPKLAAPAEATAAGTTAAAKEG